MLKWLENCPFFAQSQKWGWNNGRSKKRRKSGKGQEEGKERQELELYGVQKARKLPSLRTEQEVRTE